MKQLAILLCFFLIWQVAFSQTNNFAPVGAKWWYSSQEFSPTITPLTIESIGDTMIDGKVCRILAYDPMPNSASFNEQLYVYYEGGRVYQYFSSEEAFFLLYDFTLSVGEGYWCHVLNTISGNLDSLYIQVTNIELISINGLELKQQYIDMEGQYDWLGVNIEHIGNTWMFIPIYGIIDIVQGPLRCYEDPEFGFYSTGETTTCDEILSGNTNLTEQEIQAYPNPFIDHLSIKVPDAQDIVSVQLRSINGVMMIDNGNSLEIDNLTQLPNGPYVLQLHFENMCQYFLIHKL